MKKSSFERIVIENIAQVIPSSSFGGLNQDTVNEHQARRIEVLKRVPQSGPLCTISRSSSLKDSTEFIIIPEQAMDVLLIPFFMDSDFGKGLLVSSSTKKEDKSTLSLRTVKSFSIPVLNDSDKFACCNLEKILCVLNIVLQQYNNSNKNYYEIVESFLSDIRNSIVMELYLNPIFSDNDVFLLQNWKNELDNLKDKDFFGNNYLSSLITNLLHPGNPLMDNYKRFQLIVDRLLVQLPE